MKRNVHFTSGNFETVTAIANQERQTFNKMVNLLISDATSGELIKKSSVREFIQANPKATGKQILEYFKLG